MERVHHRLFTGICYASRDEASTNRIGLVDCETCQSLIRTYEMGYIKGREESFERGFSTGFDKAMTFLPTGQ